MNDPSCDCGGIAKPVLFDGALLCGPCAARRYDWEIVSVPDGADGSRASSQDLIAVCDGVDGRVVAVEAEHAHRRTYARVWFVDPWRGWGAAS